MAFYLSTLLAFAISVSVSTSIFAQQTKQVSQIVIVYAPTKDWNGAFSRFDENLTRLMSAAESKKLRVVLINTDKFDGPNAKDLIKNAVAGAVRSHSSIVMLATHGGNESDPTGNTDTNLSFSGGISFNDLSEAFENQPNLTGVVIQACHSDNTKLPELGKRAVACASSQNNRTSTTNIVYAFNNVLTAAINIGKVDDLAVHMRSGLVSQLESMSDSQRKDLVGENEDYSKLPIYGPKGMSVEFKGAKYEVVGPFNNELKVCMSVDKKIASLPSQVMPRSAISELLIDKIDDYRRKPFFFESRSPNATNLQNLRAECSDKGEIVIRGNDAVACVNMAVSVGKDCESSFAKALKDPRYRRDLNTFVGITTDATAQRFCQQFNGDLKTFAAAGAKIEVKSICLAPNCSFSNFETGASYNYGVGQCTPTGGMCTPTAKGSFIIDSDECRELTKIGELSKDPCLATDGKSAKPGTCFVPRLPPNRISGFFSHPFIDADEKDVFATIHQSAAFKCDGKRATIDAKCCTDSGGTYKESEKPEPEYDFTTSDTKRHQEWLSMVVRQQNRCVPKPPDFMTENGAFGGGHGAGGSYPGGMSGGGFGGYGGGMNGGGAPNGGYAPGGYNQPYPTPQPQSQSPE